MICPKVSVIMSVYNAEKYLNEAIESILNQKFKDFELIIINDGSTDSSLEIVQSYNDERLVLLDQKNAGNSIARNRAIQISKSNYIAILDADDISMPDRLEKQYYFIQNNPDYVVVGSNAEIIDMNGNYVFTSKMALSDEEIRMNFPQMPCFHSSVIFIKNAFYEAGKYSEKMLVAQDNVLLIRMSKFGKIINLPESLIKYRIVPTANSVRDNRYSKIYKNMILKAIQYNTISDEDFKFLLKIQSNNNYKLRLANYHLYLAKKYLWNNYQPDLSKLNLIKSLANKFGIQPLLYYLISFFPKKLIIQCYNTVNKR